MPQPFTVDDSAFFVPDDGSIRAFQAACELSLRILGEHIILGFSMNLVRRHGHTQ